MARFRLFLEKVHRNYQEYDSIFTIVVFSLGLISVVLPIIYPTFAIISLIPTLFILCVLIPHAVLRFAAQRWGSSIPAYLPDTGLSIHSNLRFITSSEIRDLARMAHEAFSHSSELSVDCRIRIYSEWHSFFPEGFVWIILPEYLDNAERENKIGFSMTIPLKADFYRKYFRSGIKSFDQFSGNDLEIHQGSPACLIIEGVYLLPKFHRSHQGLGVSMLFSHLRYLIKKQRLKKPVIATEPVNRAISKMLDKAGICKVATTKDNGDLYELDLSSNLSAAQLSFVERHLNDAKSPERKRKLKLTRGRTPIKPG